MQASLRYAVSEGIFKGFHGAQAKTLSLVVGAIVDAGVVSSLAIAQHLAAQLGIHADSALNRFYRVLRNPRFETYQVTLALLGALSQKAGDVLIAVDWTEWVDDKRVLVGSVIAGTRGVPVAAASHHKATFFRSQNAFENIFFQQLALACKSIGVKATVLADRGFRRVSLIRILQNLSMPFVIRLQADVSVCVDGRWTRLRNLNLRRGQARDLGMVLLGEDRANRLPVRVIGVKAPGQKDAWWLATSHEFSVSHVVAMYDRRMATEECFRDTKGCHFGLKMEWTQFQKCDHIDRLFVLTGVAIMLLISMGHLIASRRPDVRLRHPDKGPRQSYLSLGLAWRYYLLERVFLELFVILEHLPRPAYRHFSWLKKPSCPLGKT